MSISIRTFSIYAIVAFLLNGTALGQPSMNLRVNDGTASKILVGAPVTLGVVVLDEQAQIQLSMNNAIVLERQEKLRVLPETNIKEKTNTPRKAKQEVSPTTPLDTLPVPSWTIGSPESPWFNQLVWRMRIGKEPWQELPWSMMLLMLPAADSVGIINGTNVVEAVFGLDPEITESIAPDAYSIQAVLPPGSIQGTTDTLWSNIVTLTLSPLPKGRLDFNTRRLLAFYRLRRGQHQRCYNLAIELNRERPNDINVLAMMGDALVGLGRPDEAAILYRQGIELYHSQKPRPYEPPVLLIEKYNAVAPEAERR